MNHMNHMNHIKQKKGLKRNIIDKFYTKNKVVVECINLCKNYLDIKDNDLIIEPSAGNGAFINEIKKLSVNCKFYDIKPEHDEVCFCNFLKFNIEVIGEVIEDKNIHVIGNPPFGRQSSLAIKFIKKSCSFADSISFILPKSFKKDSMKKYFFKNFHLVVEIDLEDKSFLVDDKEYDVPCIFQIWQKKDFNRIETKKLEPINFQFVKKNDNPDLSFRRVGVYAGNISLDYKDKSIQSHYFIKFNFENKNIDINDIINNLKNIKFNFNNTVGPKSISKQELIKEFNKYTDIYIFNT